MSALHGLCLVCFSFSSMKIMKVGFELMNERAKLM